MKRAYKTLHYTLEAGFTCYAYIYVRMKILHLELDDLLYSHRLSPQLTRQGRRNVFASLEKEKKNEQGVLPDATARADLKLEILLNLVMACQCDLMMEGTLA